MGFMWGIMGIGLVLEWMVGKGIRDGMWECSVGGFGLVYDRGFGWYGQMIDSCKR